MRPHGLHWRVVDKRGFASQHLVEDDGQGVKVARRHHGIAKRLFRAQVLRGTDNHASTGHSVHGSVAHEFGDAEVEDLQFLPAFLHRHEQVVGLDVPVEDVVLVSFLQRTAGLQEQMSGPYMVHGGLISDDAGQGPALQQFHGVIQQPVPGDAEVVQGHRVPAVQRSNGPGLVEEPLDRTFVLDYVLAQNLQGDDPLDEVLLGLVDHPHTAPSDPLQNRIPLVQYLAREVLVRGRNQVRPVFRTALSALLVFLEAFRAVLLHSLRSVSITDDNACRRGREEIDRA